MFILLHESLLFDGFYPLFDTVCISCPKLPEIAKYTNLALFTYELDQKQAWKQWCSILKTCIILDISNSRTWTLLALKQISRKNKIDRDKSIRHLWSCLKELGKLQEIRHHSDTHQGFPSYQSHPLPLTLTFNHVYNRSRGSMYNLVITLFTGHLP